MKVLLLGATGRLGNEILKQLSVHNKDVNILVRDPDKLNTQAKNISVFKGNPIDQNDLDNAMAGCNSIITSLNISRNSDFPWAKLRSPIDLLSVTMNNLINLMPKHDINRIITISAWGANETKKELPIWFRWLIENSNIRYGYKDHEIQEKLLIKTNLNWSIIRPVGLNNSKKIKTAHASLNKKPKNFMISRRCVAKFIVEILNNDSYIKKIPTLS